VTSSGLRTADNDLRMHSAFVPLENLSRGLESHSRRGYTPAYLCDGEPKALNFGYTCVQMYLDRVHWRDPMKTAKNFGVHRSGKNVETTV